jgi:alcohol dehydrogenase YqhD (iron-dependent ADH family)
LWRAVFGLGKEDCWAIHEIGHQIAAKYDIDHGPTLSIVGLVLLETQLQARKGLMAKTAEFVFGVEEGSEEEKARAFIQKLREFIVEIGQPLKVPDCEGVIIAPGDVDELVE